MDIVTYTQQNLTFVRTDSPEWARMWSLLAASQPLGWVGDNGCEHPQCGEVWQYMGTWQGRHQFRHRCHPATNARMVLEFLAA